MSHPVHGAPCTRALLTKWALLSNLVQHMGATKILPPEQVVLLGEGKDEDTGRKHSWSTLVHTSRIVQMSWVIVNVSRLWENNIFPLWIKKHQRALHGCELAVTQRLHNLANTDIEK